MTVREGEQTRPVSSISADELKQEQQAWRERALSGIAWSLALACGLTSLWFVVVPNPMPEMSWLLAAATALMIAVATLRKVPYLVRASALLATLYVPCLYALSVGGFAPNPFIGLGMVVISATLLFGRSTGLALLALSVLTTVGVSLGHRSGALDRHASWALNLDSMSLAVSVRVALIFGLLMGTLVLTVTYLLSRAEELLEAKARSLETVRREQAEKAQIARDLELREAAFQKARELELLGRLAGTMAHDFNNALLVVWTALDELKALPGIPAPAVSAISAIRVAADQAAATTRQLRAFGPMAPRRPTEVKLTELLTKAQDMFARVLPRNVRLRTELGVEAAIIADEGEVLRVLLNLALNARDAMREGGDLILRVRAAAEVEQLAGASGSVVAVEVEDSGSGMSEDVKARLFEPFFTTKAASGTGLGLASVRDLLEAQGGAVRVKSSLGVGSTFTLLWPMAPKGAIRAETPTSAPSLESKVVLLVDDDPAVRMALSRSLARRGMTVLDAPDGAAALVAARRHAGGIDVLCTDCVMAGLPVPQLIASFREQYQGRVIVCSGYAPSETGLANEQFDDFLAKPFTIDDLVKRIAGLLS